MREQVLRAAEPAAFDIESRELCGGRRSEVDVQAARVVALVRRVERQKGSKGADVLSRRRDDDDRERIELRAQLDGAEMVVDSVEADDADRADLHQLGAGLLFSLLQVATLSRSVGPLVQFFLVLQWFCAGRMRGIEPQLQSILHGQVGIGPGFGGMNGERSQSAEQGGCRDESCRAGKGDFPAAKRRLPIHRSLRVG